MVTHFRENFKRVNPCPDFQVLLGRFLVIWFDFVFFSSSSSLHFNRTIPTKIVVRNYWLCEWLTEYELNELSEFETKKKINKSK